MLRPGKRSTNAGAATGGPAGPTMQKAAWRRLYKQSQSPQVRESDSYCT